jgi:uncharacterized protein YndB with AHSA1/START domain
VKTEHQAKIDCPADEVFSFLADGTNNPRWQPPVIQTDAPNGPVGAGTKFRQRVRHPFGFKVSADYEIVEYEPPDRLVVRTISGGPIRPSQRYELASNADGSTSVRSIVECELSGLMRLAVPLLPVLYPLFAWEASWIDNVRDLLSGLSSHSEEKISGT